jgi:hypothetical protein
MSECHGQVKVKDDEQSGHSTKSTLREQLHPPRLIGVGGLIMHGNRSLQRCVERVESRRVKPSWSWGDENVWWVSFCLNGALQVGPRDVWMDGDPNWPGVKTLN